jgi:hypothetical protein
LYFSLICNTRLRFHTPSVWCKVVAFGRTRNERIRPSCAGKKARDFGDRLRARIDELVNDPDRAALKKKVADFADHLKAQTDQFKKNGQFSGVYKALLKQIRQCSDQLRKNVAEAERKGTNWEIIKAEFARDLGSIYDDWLIFEEQLEGKINKTIIG